jgi:hypothetical protein
MVSKPTCSLGLEAEPALDVLVGGTIRTGSVSAGGLAYVVGDEAR